MDKNRGHAILNAELPPIDVAGPKIIETATFSLG